MQNKRRIKYCRNYLMPEIKLDLPMDAEGVRGACRSYKRRKEVNWYKRKQELLTFMQRYRSRNGNNYDCIVPDVSPFADSMRNFKQRGRLYQSYAKSRRGVCWLNGLII